MRYRIRNAEIEIVIPAANNGKFRFKKRENCYAFGRTFPTRTEPFDKQTYLEWQIGYDILAKDVEAAKIGSGLYSQSFVGSNGKEKFPYELSELYYRAIGLGLIAKQHVRQLLEEISAYRELIDEREIRVEEMKTAININGILFEESCIRLPTLFMSQTSDGTQIEVAIKQQQYASGVQPMIYFCIPLDSFRNSSGLLGRPSRKEDELIYVINNGNAQNLTRLMEVFGMASKRHQHDIIEIIKVILKII